MPGGIKPVVFWYERRVVGPQPSVGRRHSPRRVGEHRATRGVSEGRES
jgi:hypothetical protein